MASTHEERAQDLLPQLMKRHPALFDGRTFDIPSDLPGGWYAIADRLCSDLEELLGDKAVHWRPIQSKEKFGSWRFYWRLELGDNFEDPGTSTGILTADIQVPPGTRAAGTFENTEISDTPVGYRISVPPAGGLRQAVHARVRLAERETESACLWCGAPGTYWTTGWIHVACSKHRRRDAMTLEAWHERRRSGERSTSEGVYRLSERTMRTAMSDTRLLSRMWLESWLCAIGPRAQARTPSR